MEYNNFKAGHYKVDNCTYLVFAEKNRVLTAEQNELIHYTSVIHSGGCMMSCSFKDFLSLNPVLVEYKNG